MPLPLVKGPDSHGWLTIGLYLLVLVILVLMWRVPALRTDDLFKMVAQAIVMTAFTNGVIQYYFGASKAQRPPAADGQAGEGGQ